MKTNMGTADRAVRALVALALVGLWFNGTITGLLGTILVVLAAVFLGTSAMGFCPLYLPLGISTCGRKGGAT